MKKYTCLIVYHENHIIQSGQFQTTDIKDYVSKLSQLFGCEIFALTNSWEPKFSVMMNAIDNDLHTVAEREIFDAESIPRIFNSCVSAQLGWKAAMSAKMFVVEQDIEFETSEFRTSEQFFQKKPPELLKFDGIDQEEEEE